MPRTRSICTRVIGSGCHAEGVMQSPHTGDALCAKVVDHAADQVNVYEKTDWVRLPHTGNQAGFITRARLSPFAQTITQGMQSLAHKRDSPLSRAHQTGHAESLLHRWSDPGYTRACLKQEHLDLVFKICLSHFRPESGFQGMFESGTLKSAIAASVSEERKSESACDV
eukprot:1151015-Pelagomonas_calceolata.AAC.4